MNATMQPTPSSLGNSMTMEYILLGDLRDLLEEDCDVQTGKWLTAVLDALLDAIPREIAERTAEGYLTEVLERFPNWSPQVERLRIEKAGIYEKLRLLRDGLTTPEKFAAIARELRMDLREWMNEFVAHHRHERRIVQQAFTWDLGAGD